MLKPLFFFFFSSVFFCATAQTPKYSNEFLSIGIGARALGFAGAYTAFADDTDAGYWNPAGLAHLTAPLSLDLMHAEWFAGIGKFDYISLAAPIKVNEGRQVLGITFIRMGIDNIPNTLNLLGKDGSINFDNVKPFSVADYALFASYAQQSVSQKWNIGGSAKTIYRQIGSFAHSWGFGIDLGAQFMLGKHKNWRLAFVARDISFTFNAWEFTLTDEEIQQLQYADNDIPENSIEYTAPSLQVGFGYNHHFMEDFSILAALDFKMTTDGKRNTPLNPGKISFEPMAGIEFGYRNFVFLRGGIGNIQKATTDLTDNSFYSFQPNVGAGLQLGVFRIDYTLTDAGNFSQAYYSHIISLNIKLRPRRKKITPDEELKPENPDDIIAPDIIYDQID